jgi:hypothetical protein
MEVCGERWSLLVEGVGYGHALIVRVVHACILHICLSSMHLDKVGVVSDACAVWLFVPLVWKARLSDVRTRRFAIITGCWARQWAYIFS